MIVFFLPSPPTSPLTDSPILVSFPHFYMADPKLREAVEGISPPEPEKHQLYIDVQPVSIPIP